MQDWRANYAGLTSSGSLKCRQPTFTNEFLSSVSAGSHSIPISDRVISPSGPVRSNPKPVKLYACADCSYSTDRKNNLKRHRMTMHERSARTLECCDQLFADKSTLREHVTREHGAGTGYACMHCGRRFGRRALMRRHVAVHEAQQQYQHRRNMPDSDEKRGRESSSEKDDSAQAAETEDAEDNFDLRFQLQQRPEKTGYGNSIVPATMTETTGPSAVTPVSPSHRRFRCQFCDYSTEHKSNLDRHRRRHVGCAPDWADPISLLTASKRRMEEEIRFPNYSTSSLHLPNGPKPCDLFQKKAPCANYPFRMELERKFGRGNKPDWPSLKDVSNEDNPVLGTNSAFQVCSNSGGGRADSANLDQILQQLSAGKYPPASWLSPAIPCTSHVTVQPFDEIVQNRLALHDSRFFNSFALMLLRSVQRSRQMEELKKLMETESNLNCNYSAPLLNANERTVADSKMTPYNITDCFPDNPNQVETKAGNRIIPRINPKYNKRSADSFGPPVVDQAASPSSTVLERVEIIESSFDAGNTDGDWDDQFHEAGQPRCRLLPLLHTCRVCSVTFVSQLQLKMHCDVTHASDEATARQAIRPITTFNQQRPQQQQQQPTSSP